MVEQAKDLDWLINESYVPSSVERKKAVLMYFLVWIIAGLAQDEVSVYEYFHLKQSIWRWMVFFVSMVFGLFLIFIPYMWIIPVLLFIIFLIIRIVFVKQSREWRYVVNNNKVVMPFYASLWEWVLTIFEFDVYDAQEITEE